VTGVKVVALEVATGVVDVLVEGNNLVADLGVVSGGSFGVPNAVRVVDEASIKVTITLSVSPVTREVPSRVMWVKYSSAPSVGWSIRITSLEMISAKRASSVFWTIWFRSSRSI